jgi:hypothetical protein
MDQATSYMMQQRAVNMQQMLHLSISGNRGIPEQAQLLAQQQQALQQQQPQAREGSPQPLVPDIGIGSTGGGAPLAPWAPAMSNSPRHTDDDGFGDDQTDDFPEPSSPASSTSRSPTALFAAISSTTSPPELPLQASTLPAVETSAPSVSKHFFCSLRNALCIPMISSYLFVPRSR